MFSGHLSGRVRTTLLHELTHDLVNRWFGWAPAWLSEGWAQYYSTTRGAGGFLFAGEALPGLTFTSAPESWPTKRRIRE